MNSKCVKGVCLVVFLLVSFAAIATTPVKDKLVIKGIVFDKKTKKAIEYATVSLYRASDNSLVTGAITDKKGVFKVDKINNGKYNISITFLGYETKSINNIFVGSDKKVIDIGKVLLGASRTVLGEVSVQGNASNVEYKIDKKVVSVGDKLTSSGMSAVEVLENVPSVKVDMDGNLTLRGSSSFTVLVDGKPTIVDAADLLQQTPASAIQNIEIITNASAKYSPDGTGGIINIITKKNKMKGISGIVNAKGGFNGTMGSDFLINYRKKNINFFVNGSYNKRVRESDITENKEILSVVASSGERSHEKIGKFISSGFSWDITPSDNIDVNLKLGKHTFSNESNLNYLNNEVAQISSNEGQRGGNYIGLTGNYIHKFGKKGHDISLQYSYRKFNKEVFTWNTLSDLSGLINSGTETVVDGPAKKSELRIDYTLPINPDTRFEAGIHIRQKHNNDETGIKQYDTEISGYSTEDMVLWDVEYDRDIYGIYSTYSSKLGNLTFQLGLRGENTYRKITSQSNGSSIKLDDFDLFPTVHLSYNLERGNQLQASYSRRIERPRGFDLKPFEVWMDMYNVRKGNPDLKNEYVDVMELTYLKDWENSRFSIEGFYRITKNLQEMIVSPYAENVTLLTVENVGTSYALGSELMYSIDVAKFWNINVSTDMYSYRISSSVDGVDNVNTFNWSANMTHKFKLRKGLDFQIDGKYNSKSEETQATIKARYAVNAALRAKITDKLFLTAQMRNIFNTWKYEVETVKNDYYHYSKFESKPTAVISLSYRINNFRLKKGKNKGGEEDMDF